MVAEISPLLERPEFDCSQPPSFRDKYVVDVEWLVLMTIKVVGWARFRPLLLIVMGTRKANRQLT
jgi:hypothetical protein